jgi:hypothetical protein
VTEKAKRPPAAFRQVRRGYWRWIRAVAAEMRAEVRATSTDIDTGEVVEHYPAGPRGAPTLRRAIEARASLLVRCMRRVEARICGSESDHAEGCGRPRSRGVFRSKEPIHGARVRRPHHDPRSRCHARSCPRCARIRAAHYHEFGERVAKLFDEYHDRQIQEWGTARYLPRHVTLTCQRDPSDPSAHTVEALRTRRAGMRDAWRAILAWLRENNPRAEWIGAFIADECSGTGHVHLHVLFYGPWVAPAEGDAPAVWTEIGRAGYTDKRRRAWPGFPSLGFIKAKGVDREAIREVAKYPLKSPGSGSKAEPWIAGKKLTVMHPRLVARWEIATFNARLVERYGLVRLVEPPESDGEGDEENEENTIAPAPAEPCPWCGCTSTRIVIMETADWIALSRVHRRRDRVRFSAFGGPSAPRGDR